MFTLNVSVKSKDLLIDFSSVKIALLADMVCHSSKDDFVTNFANEFGIRKMWFKKELVTNRDDSMTSFAQNITKVYKDKK